MGNVSLEIIHRELENIRNEMSEIKENLNELMNIELEVRPEYLKKLSRIKKEKGIPFKSIDDLRNMIER